MIKLHRATIGNRIGSMFLDIIELSYHAYYATGNEKLSLIIQTMKKLDTMKLLVSIAWEGKLIQNKQYLNLSEELQEISKMLGGWRKGVESKLNETKPG
jgi:hypothetical protein